MSKKTKIHILKSFLAGLAYTYLIVYLVIQGISGIHYASL
jgi:hypothetical protein